MKFFLTGGTGFVGSNLTARLTQQGHTVTVLTRSSRSRPDQAPAVTYVQGDPVQPGAWQQQVPEHDVVINLAGTAIFLRWTPVNKKSIRDSRILTTRNLVQAMAAAPARQTKLLLSTSAIGYYGDCGEALVTEESPPGNDFLAQVCRDWEAEAFQARDFGVRVAACRFGLVLGRGGGILGNLVPLFNKFLGGPVGSGQQWFSWIDQSDLVGAFLFVLENRELDGPVNFTAPNPLRNADFARALGTVLNRPSSMPAPAFMVKMVLGEFAGSILGGQKVLPAKLQGAGFTFDYPTIEVALGHQLL